MIFINLVGDPPHLYLAGVLLLTGLEGNSEERLTALRDVEPVDFDG